VVEPEFILTHIMSNRFTKDFRLFIGLALVRFHFSKDASLLEKDIWDLVRVARRFYGCRPRRRAKDRVLSSR
jgi:hypothetical protein